MASEFVEDVKAPKDVQHASDGISKLNTNGSLDSDVEDFIAKFLDINNNAKDDDKRDKEMPLREGLRTFPKAAFWSIVLSTALIMEGYDTSLLNSLYALPAFQRKYGEFVSGDSPDAANAHYELPTRIQTALSMCVNVGEVIGLAIAGVVADRIGYRWTLIISLMMTTGFIFIVFFSKDWGMLIAGELLMGIPWGAFQTLTVTYASEVCPLVLRVYLTTYVNVCWVFGQLISSGVLRAMLDVEGSNSYRIPWAIQWVWPIPIMIGIYLSPESPWWLTRQGKFKEAKHSIERLLSENKYLPDKRLLAEAMLNKMQLTLKEEALNSNGAGISYLDCVKGKNFRRTRVAAIVWLIQNITGSALMGYSTYFYVQAGLSTDMSFNFSIIQYCIGVIGTFGSWFVSRKLGRFTIYFGGLVINSCVLLLVGILGCLNSKGASWGVGSLLLVYTFVYDISVGPLCYCIVPELPSARLRTKTVIIARNIYNIGGIVTAIITPYMLNPQAWNWKAKTGFFWAGFAICSATWCWFELPETKGRTYAELDALFKDKVPARKFKYTQVEVFNAEEMLGQMGKDGVKDLVHEIEEDNSTA